MKRYFSVLGLWLVLVGCQATPAEQAQTQAPHDGSRWNRLMQEAVRATSEALDSSDVRRVPRGKKPEVIFNNTDITINDQKLVLGDDLSKWVEALGQPSRKLPQDRLYLWDRLGLSVVVSDRNANKVKQVDVVLNKKPQKEMDYSGIPWMPPKLENYSPEGVFPGYLELESIGIDAKSTVSDINALLERKEKFYCTMSRNVCFTGWIGDAGHYEFTFDTDSEQNHGIIYRLTVSLPEG